MKLLATIRHQDIFPGDKTKVTKYEERKAARAVVFDKDKTPILFVSKKNYHKLPGGGLEENESIEDALKREVLEETGCNIDLVGEIGEVVEYRDKLTTKQISYCYLAKIKGKKINPLFSEDEIEDAFILKWLSLQDAINTLQNDKPEDYQGFFIQKRDLIFLKESQEKLRL